MPCLPCVRKSSVRLATSRSSTMPRVSKAVAGEPATKALKKLKKVKDPNAPKRARTAYMCWLAENRPRIAKPGMSVVDVAKAAGLEWNALTNKDKWNKIAEDDKKRYQKEIESYKASRGDGGGASTSASKAEKK